MRYIVILVTTSLAVIAGSGCETTHRVYHVKEGAAIPAHGVQYSLPQTIITVDVPVTKRTVEYTELFKDYVKAKPKEADEIIKEIVGKAGIKHAIGTPKVGTRSRPDPAARFYVQIEGGTFEERALALDLTEAGLLSSGDSKAEDKTIDVAVKTLEVAAGVIGKMAFAAGEPGAPKPPRSVEDIVRDFKKLNGTRYDLVAGKPLLAMRADTLDRMLKEIDVLQRGLLAELRTVKEETAPQSFEIIVKPEHFTGGSLKTFPLLSLPGTGESFPSVVVNSDYSTTAMTLGDLQANSTEIVLEIKIDGEWSSNSADSVVEDESSPSGFFYRLPVPVIAKVLSGGREQARERMMVAQLGRVASLPSSPGGKASQYKVGIYPDTGGLKSLSVSSTAMGTGAVEGVGRAVGTAIDGNAKASDELSALDRQYKILELKKKIRELQQEQVIAPSPGQ